MKNRLLIPVMLLILLIITPTIYVVKNYLKENTKLPLSQTKLVIKIFLLLMIMVQV
ncbi:hypothetical protein [Halothermothrix orenii]|uniref:hypothetical protein n=1 Tax=Halothermothrix orenii TaxID=31909 RepID=UPI001D04ECB6|nr:hypothetical protein [Halothermothrix orenii]